MFIITIVIDISTALVFIVTGSPPPAGMMGYRSRLSRVRPMGKTTQSHLLPRLLLIFYPLATHSNTVLTSEYCGMATKIGLGAR